jgi:serine/threonine-protein kinase
MKESLSPPAAPLETRPVTRLGQYQLFATLGQGGMANVYLAAAEGVRGVRKLSVVKCLRPSLAEEPRVVAMFLDEARLAVRLHHPNVIQTFGAGECDGTYFIAMEYLEGQPLKKLARLQEVSGKRFPEALWLRVVSDVLAGLDYAHNLADYDGRPLGIVHRDISPHNVFLTYLGHVQILDFGIAKAALNTTKTEEGVFKGKANYMAPEQVVSDQAIDRRADIFSTGVVLWELLAARRLYCGDLTTVLCNVVGQPIPAVSTVVPDVDPVLDAIVARALEKDPAARYQSARDMRDDIEAYLRAKGHVFGERELESLLQEQYGEQRDSRMSEVRAVMQRLDRRKDSSGLDSLRPLQTASRPGESSRRSLVSSGIRSTPSSVSGRSSRRVGGDLAELAELAELNVDESPKSASRRGMQAAPAPRDVAADLAELESPGGGADTGAKGSAAPRVNWLLVAAIAATIAALVGWFR